MECQAWNSIFPLVTVLITSFGNYLVTIKSKSKCLRKKGKVKMLIEQTFFYLLKFCVASKLRYHLWDRYFLSVNKWLGFFNSQSRWLSSRKLPLPLWLLKHSPGYLNPRNGVFASSWNVKKTAIKIKGIQIHGLCNLCYSFDEIILKTYRWLSYSSMCSVHSSNPKPWERSFKDGVEEYPDISPGEGRPEMCILAHPLSRPLFFFLIFQFPALY